MAGATPGGASDGPVKYMRQEIEEIVSKKFKKFTKLPCAECGVAAGKRFSDSGPLVVKAMLDTFWCGECGRLLCEGHRHAHTCERHDAKKEALAAMAPEKLRERMEEEKRQKAAAEEAAKAPQRAAVAAADERRRRRYTIAEKTQLVANFIQLASREEGRSEAEIERLLGFHARVQRILTFLWNEFESPTLPGIAEKEWEELKQVYWSVTEVINVVVAVPRNGDWEQPDDWVELDMVNDWEEGAGAPTKTVLQPTLAEARALGNRLRQEGVPAQEAPAPRAAAAPAAAPAHRAAAPEPAAATRDVFEELADPTTEGITCPHGNQLQPMVQAAIWSCKACGQNGATGERCAAADGCDCKLCKTCCGVVLHGADEEGETDAAESVPEPVSESRGGERAATPGSTTAPASAASAPVSTSAPSNAAAPASAARAGAAGARQNVPPQPVLFRSMPRPTNVRPPPDGYRGNLGIGRPSGPRLLSFGGFASRPTAVGRGSFTVPGKGKGTAGRGKGGGLARPSLPSAGKGRPTGMTFLAQGSSRAGYPITSASAGAAGGSTSGKRTEAPVVRPEQTTPEATRPAPVSPEPEPRPSSAPAAVSTAWTVVGGADAGGILVREGKGLQTPELGRLSVGAVVEELEQREGRLQYRKVSGGGPELGWVSLVVKGKELLRKISGAE